MRFFVSSSYLFLQESTVKLWAEISSTLLFGELVSFIKNVT